MKTLSWKLLPLFALLAACALVARGASIASAAFTTFTVGGQAATANITAGGNASVFLDWTDNATAVTIVSSNAAAGAFSGGVFGGANAAPLPVATVGATSITLASDGDAAEQTTFTTTFYCSVAGGTTTITATHTPDTASVTVNCGTASASLVATAGTPVVVSGTCDSANQVITANTGGTFAATGTNITSAGGLTATCTSASAFNVNFTCNANVQVTFSLSSTALSQQVTCTTATAAALTVTPTYAVVGGTALVYGTCASQGQVLTASGGGTFILYPVPVNGTVSGQTVTCLAAGAISATYQCSYAATTTFSLASATPAYLTCTGGAGYPTNPGVTTGYLSVNPPSGSQAIVNGQCITGQSLTASGGGYFSSANVAGINVASNGSLSAYCQVDGYISATFICNSTASTVYFYLGGASGTLACNGGLVNGVTTVSGAASNLTVTANPQTVNCGGSSSLSIQVRDANGNPVANGATVLVTTTGGTLSPTQTTTSNGTAQVSLQAPSSANSITVTAASGVALNSTNINVSCTSTAPVSPPAITQAVTQAIARASGSISPPNTGDAGLAGVAEGLTAVTGFAAW